MKLKLGKKYTLFIDSFGVDLTWVDNKRGWDVKYLFSVGRLWPAFPIEFENLVIFSNAAEKWYHNFRLIADTSDRRPDAIKVTRKESYGLDSGQSTVSYFVLLPVGSTADAHRTAIDKLAASAAAEGATVYVEGKEWHTA